MKTRTPVWAINYQNQNEAMRMNRLNPGLLVGKQFGRWTVVSQSTERKRGNILWLCRCECGNTGLLICSTLRDGLSKSCGCGRVIFNQTTPRSFAWDGKSPTERFWSNVVKTDGCWEWRASGYTNGYGYFRFKGTRYSTHRLSWILSFGPIGEGLNVLHKCDNRKCVRPDHLFLGTQQDNIRDMVAKGRHAKQRSSRGLQV